MTVVSDQSSVRLSYECRIRAAGHVTFPGIHIRLQDPAGLFQVDRCLRENASFRVFPSFVSVGDVRPGIKRINSLPQHGVHRLQRAGFGSELLELREYQPGDPPKAIAWKVSARRDRLMTRQYESEVPVRVTLFVDGCAESRAGGYGRRLLDQILFSAASIAKASVSIGDPIAAVLLDERGTRRVPSGTGDRAFYRLLEALGEFAENPDVAASGFTPELLRAAFVVCRERYPELLDDRVNLPPFTWLPLRPKNRRLRHDRTLLAIVLAELYDLSPMDVLRMVHDDLAMGPLAGRFLADNGIAWNTSPVRSHIAGGSSPELRQRAISRALATAVARSHDNEVFVILTDLIGCANGLGDLLPVVRMALGRHHRVVFISPTPTGQRPDEWIPAEQITSAADVFRQAEHLQTAELASRVRRQLRRIGASVGFAGAPQATAIVLAEAELAGRGRSVAGRGN